jgi:uncharacterized protein (TIGR02246 family)
MTRISAMTGTLLLAASAGLVAQTVPSSKTGTPTQKTAPVPAPKSIPAPATGATTTKSVPAAAPKSSQAPKSTQAPQPIPASGSPRAADEAAIRATNEAFAKAFNAGDSKAIAALFTEDAEVIDEYGERTVGRDAIAGQLASLFEVNPGQTIELTTDSIKFLGPEVAREEGRSKISPPGGVGGSDFTRYTVVHVKRDGKWLQATERDEPDQAVSHHDRLLELAWMVGEWVNETAGAVVFTSCDWAENGNFLVRAFTVHLQGQPAMSGSQRIGWDPLTRQIKSWVFDSEGGYGEALWTREDNTWVVKATGVLSDGKIATATHIITLEGKDQVRWRSVDRTLGTKPAADVEEIVLVRKPPKPR